MYIFGVKVLENSEKLREEEGTPGFYCDIENIFKKAFDAKIPQIKICNPLKSTLQETE
jgi:hypothetical protein